MKVRITRLLARLYLRKSLKARNFAVEQLNEIQKEQIFICLLPFYFSFAFIYKSKKYSFCILRHHIFNTTCPLHNNKVFWVGNKFVPFYMFHFVASFQSISIYVNKILERNFFFINKIFFLNNKSWTYNILFY